jgi:hypothetical protein
MWPAITSTTSSTPRWASSIGARSTTSALLAKAALFDALGVMVHLIGDVAISRYRHAPRRPIDAAIAARSAVSALQLAASYGRATPGG